MTLLKRSYDNILLCEEKHNMTHNVYHTSRKYIWGHPLPRGQILGILLPPAIPFVETFTK